MGKSKFFVGADFRKNDLADKKTSMRAEVHEKGKSIKIYDNIHYPKALSKKIFSGDNQVSHIVFKNVEKDTEETIVDPRFKKA